MSNSISNSIFQPVSDISKLKDIVSEQNQKNNSLSGLIKEKQGNIVTSNTVVSISNEALRKSQEEFATSDEVTASKKYENKKDTSNYPVEYYQIPSWYSDIFTSSVDTTLLGQPDGDKGQKNNKIDILSSSEKSYYYEAKEKLWQSFLEENGFKDSREKYYQELIVDKESSERYRQQWEERLSSDPKLMEIYQKGSRL